MTKAFVFWLLMLLWLLLGVWWYWPGYAVIGVGVCIPFLLFALLGWQVFGRPIT